MHKLLVLSAYPPIHKAALCPRWGDFPPLPLLETQLEVNLITLNIQDLYSAKRFTTWGQTVQLQYKPIHFLFQGDNTAP